jgi:hypothetical protein
MPGALAADWSTDEPYQGIAGLLGAGLRAWLIAAAGSVHLTGCNASLADLRTLSTPNSSVSVVNRDRRAGEALAGCDYGGE